MSVSGTIFSIENLFSDMIKSKYILPMFPYPSGKLHLGHVRIYTFADLLNRFHHQLSGIPPFTPMGWDAFGLPAENAAIKRGIHPKDWTLANIDSMKKCLKELDLNLDWDSEINTSSPEYYKWTQYLFLRLYSQNLAYQKESLVNWDPIDQTVLANEQVDHRGRAERSGAKVEKKFMKQWFLKITNYSDRLLHDLDKVNWPEKVKQQQRNWIREKKGVNIKANVYDTTTDTILYHSIFLDEGDFLKMPESLHVGVSHPLAKKLNKLGIGWNKFQIKGLQLDDPYNRSNQPLPVFLNTDINEEAAILKASESPRFSDISYKEWIVEKKGKPAQIYRLRDWLISRQRFWGTPIPIIHCAKCGPVGVPEKDLPVILPNSIEKDCVIVADCPKCGTMGVREMDTMDTFVDSSWYWARFADPHNETQ